MKLLLSSITAVGWAVLKRLDDNAPCPFTVADLEHAIDNGGVIHLLRQLDDENGFIDMALKVNHDEVERALTDAGSALNGRWARKTGVENNVHCHVMAMVLEAIQQNFKSS